MEKRNEDLIIQTAELQKQLDNLTKDFTDLSTISENQIEILQNKIDEFEEALNNMTNDYELSEQYNNELYEDYLALVNSKNELQARLDNLISDISLSCPPIEFTDLDMASEQLFCTNGFIKPVEYSFDETIYSFSFIQDSIPDGINIIKSDGLIKIVGSPVSRDINLYSFDLKFFSNQCETTKRVVLARSPESPTIELVSGQLSQTLSTGTQIEPIKFAFGGSSEGLSFSDLPEGINYSVDANIYTISGSISTAGSFSFNVSTINQGSCGTISDTISFEVEQLQTNTGGGGSSGSGGSSTTQYQLTVNTGPNGSVSSSGGTYNDGSSISITASPDTGYGFVNWTDSSGNELSTNPTYTFNITSDTTITANYEELLFYLHSNGVTILCPNAIVGAIGTVDGVQYTKVDRNTLIAKRNAGENLALVCTSGITDLSNMFRKMGEAANSAGSGIGNWDTSSVTTIAKIFSNGWFNQDISNWDVSNVTNMLNAFNGANKFDQDLSGWDTSSVVNMSTTFRRAARFKSDISGWNTSSVTDMRNFLKETEDFDHDLSGWTVNNVTQCEGFYLDSNMPEDKIPNFTNCNPD